MKPAIEGGHPQRKTFLVFGKPDIHNEEIEEVVKTLKSGWISHGPRVEKFEQDFRHYKNVSYALALSSCTAGLFLILKGLGIKEGKKVLLPSFTFVSTANVIIHLGAEPVFLDIDEDTMNVSLDEIHKNMDKAHALIAVHLAGYPAPVSGLKSKILLIEDAAHAVETYLDETPAGKIGHAASFSFYATKNITTAEGGMVTTEDEELYNYIKIARLHGLSKDAWKRYDAHSTNSYEAILPGYKFNLTDIQAAIGIHQLKRIEDSYKKRKKIWEFYTNELKDNKFIITPHLPERGRHALHLYIIRLRLNTIKVDRSFIIQALKHENIGTGIHFKAVHLHKFYRNMFPHIHLPVSEKLSNEVLSLPLTAGMSLKDAQDVVSALKKILKYYER